MQISDCNYFSVQAWMVNKLKLHGAERDVYAIIYGYSQDEDSDFHGSLEYMSQLTGYSRNAICAALKSLTEKKLLLKVEKVVNNIKYCRYRTSNLDTVQVTCTPDTKNGYTPVQATLTNNKNRIKIINKNNNISQNQEAKIQTFISLYSELCPSLPKIKVVTNSRKEGIKRIIKKHSLEEIKTVFEKAQASDFLTGKNNTGWKANIDFFLREDKFVNILEGMYGGKQGVSSKIGTDVGLNLNRVADKQQIREDIQNGKAEKF